MIYCIVQISSGEVVWKGRSCAIAAAHWEPGTVWGKGLDLFDAQFKANMARKKILAAQAKQGSKATS